MLVQEECVEVHALKQRGWSISAIARHLGRDRKTVRVYLLGERIPGERARIGSDPFDRFEAYVRQRLADDPHVWASALFDEIAALGYSQSYPTLVRKIRYRGLRPSCDGCAGTRGRPSAIIDHPPGEECQSVLGRTRRHPVGVPGLCAGWCPFVFGPVSRVGHDQPGPATPGGGD